MEDGDNENGDNGSKKILNEVTNNQLNREEDERKKREEEILRLRQAKENFEKEGNKVLSKKIGNLIKERNQSFNTDRYEEKPIQGERSVKGIINNIVINKREQALKKQERKINEQQLKDKLNLIKQSGKKPSNYGVARDQIAASFGFTREGVYGAKIAEQKLATQINTVSNYKKNLKELKSLYAKNKQNKTSFNEKKKLQDLKLKINAYQNKTNIEQAKFDAMKQDRINESKYRYATPGAIKSTAFNSNVDKKEMLTKGRNIKKIQQIEVGRGRSTDPFGLFSKRGPKKNFGPRFDQLLADVNRITGQQAPIRKEPKQLPSEIADDEMPDVRQNNELNEPVKPNNEFGVEDWIMDI